METKYEGYHFAKFSMEYKLDNEEFRARVKTYALIWEMCNERMKNK
jgi:hypothetical protein